MKRQRQLAALMIGLFAFALAAGTLLAAEPDKKAWLENWYKQNPQWRALHMMRAPKPENLPKFEKLIAESLVPAGINVLILGINYEFQYQSHPELKCTGMNKKQARELVETCHKCGIRLIPLFECLGHQPSRGGLLKAHPEFDQPLDIPAGDKHSLQPRVVPLEPGREQGRLRPVRRIDRCLPGRRPSRGDGRSVHDRQQELSPLPAARMWPSFSPAWSIRCTSIW